MGWGNFSSQGGGSQKRASQLGYVMHGDVPVYLFTEKPTLCRFMTKDVDIEEVMRQNNMIKEQAEEYIINELSHQEWIMPKPVWRHTIPPLKDSTGKMTRYFSTSVCWGKFCPLCEENQIAKQNGVDSNQMLPFPISKRYYSPAYFYDLKMILFVENGEDFFEDVGAYINKHGSDIDFEIFSVGQSVEKRYKITFNGPSQFKYADILAAGHTIISPDAFSPIDIPEEIKRKVTGGRREGSYQQTAPANPSLVSNLARLDPVPVATPINQYPIPTALKDAVPPPAPNPPGARVIQSAYDPNFKINFGAENGKTIEQIVSEGKAKLIELYARNSNGDVKDQCAFYIQNHPEKFS
jgi:hypothetical protein